MIRRMLIVLTALLAPAVSGAAPITYTFTGTVSTVDSSLAGTFNTSQILSGSFTYESTTTGFLATGTTQASGFSDYYNAVTNVVLTVGSYSAEPPISSYDLLQVANNWSSAGWDGFLLGVRLTGTQFNGFNPLFAFFLFDSTQTMFSNTYLTDVGDLTGRVASASWYLAFSDSGDDPRISGQLTSVTLVQSTVPEPASLLLLGTGLVGAVRAVRRKRA